jgi:hypothetical protein
MAAPAIDVRRLPLVTTSEMRAFRACARAWHFGYGLRRRPLVARDVLRFGTLVHVGLEAWWAWHRDDQTQRCCPHHTPLAAAAEAIDSGPVDLFDHAKASALLTGYDARWCDDTMQVLGVEVEFRAPLRNPDTGAASKTYELGGKLDAIVRISSGPYEGVWVVEHKTTSEDITPGSDYWKRLRLDAQISIYMVGARALGYEPRGVLYDVIRKPGVQPLRATPVESRRYTKQGALYAAQRDRDETPAEYKQRVLADIGEQPDRYYQRGFVVRTEDDERDAAFDAWATASLMREAQRAERFPRNVDGCVRFGSACSYFAVCCGEASIDDDARYRTAARKHEELEEP